MNSCFKLLLIFEKFSWFIVAIALLITNWLTVFHCCRCLHHWTNIIEATNFGDSKFMFHLTKSSITKELYITHMEHAGRNNSVIYWHWPVRIAYQIGHHTGYVQSLISESLYWFTKENYLCWRLSTYWAHGSQGKRLQRVTRIVDQLLVRKWYTYFV